MAEPSALARELDYYTRHKGEWLRQKSGKYVVIRDDAVLGFFPSFEKAYTAGATSYGIDTSFLVKQIVEHEPVFFLF